jgi:hypothetical protein
MHGSLRIDIFKGDRQIILINNVGGYFPTNDPTEKGVCGLTHIQILCLLTLIGQGAGAPTHTPKE